MGVRKYRVILICIFLMVNHVKHVFIYLLAIVYSFKNAYSGPLPIFESRGFRFSC